MLNLPTKTDMSKTLTKTAIYSKFAMNTATKEKFDKNIKKITIINEVSPEKINIVKGEEVGSFYVLLVALKNQLFDEKNIILLSKLIPQKMLFVLEFEQKACLAIYHTKLIKSAWQAIDNLSIELKGLNFDSLWENIIVQIGDIQIEENNSLDQQLQINEQAEKLKKKIAQLEKKAWSEKQPRKKFELVQEIKRLQKGLE